MFEKKYSSQKAYGSAKFAIVLFKYELARRLDGTGVTVNALHPGHARTKMTQTNISWIIKKIMNLFSKSPKEAAVTSVYLASSPEVEGISGKYFKKCISVKSHKMTYDEIIQKKVWEISEKLIHILNNYLKKMI